MCNPRSGPVRCNFLALAKFLLRNCKKSTDKGVPEADVMIQGFKPFNLLQLNRPQVVDETRTCMTITISYLSPKDSHLITNYSGKRTLMSPVNG